MGIGFHRREGSPHESQRDNGTERNRRSSVRSFRIPCAVQIPPKPGVTAGQFHLKPGVIAGHKVYHGKIRNYAYCEIAPVLGEPPKVIAQLYDTSAPGDYCPLDKMEVLDAEKLAAELGGLLRVSEPHPAKRQALLGHG